jgi:hypothetical protein
MNSKQKILVCQQSVQLLQQFADERFNRLLQDLAVQPDSADADWLFDVVFNNAELSNALSKLKTVDLSDQTPEN